MRQEIEAKDRALDDLKEIADRAVKLAGIGEKSSIMDVVEWVIRAAIFAIRGHFKGARSLAVLLVADLFHPVGGFAFELFLKGDMDHGRGRRSAMPVFQTRRDPDNVTLPYFLN